MTLLAGQRAGILWALVGIATLIALNLAGAWLPDVSQLILFTGTSDLMSPVLSTVFLTAAAVWHERWVVRRQAAVEAARKQYEEARAHAEAAHAEAERARAEATEARLAPEQANQAKSTFLATMSHEIRTLLTAAVVLSELLRKQVNEPQHARQLEVLAGGGRTLLGLVGDVLDLSRIEAGELELEEIPVDLSAVVRDVTAILQTQCNDRGVDLRVATPPSAWVLGDPLRFRQVLLNVLGNAVKFTEAGHIDVDLVTEQVDATSLVTLRCTATGEGIAPEKIHAILQPFIQADRSTAPRHGGSGLGLSIVTRIVESMNGSMEIDSTPGVGTTVRLTVTLKTVLPLGDAAERSSASTPTPTAGLRVLLAEGNRVNQEVICALLEHLGCTVTVADDGARAISAALDAEEPHDLVLMDCQMPGTDWLHATRLLRVAGFTTPIVALTANATPADRRKCSEAGMDAFASKPITIDELRAVIRRAAHPRSAA